MARPRSASNKTFPRGLREKKGYYSYRSPLDGREIGLGRDRREAFHYAITNNAATAAVQQKYCGDASLLSADQISAAAKPVSALCGVYFLLKNDQIVYVGKSINVHSRLSEHYAKKVMAFDRFHIVPCDPRDVDHLEALYIGAQGGDTLRRDLDIGELWARNGRSLVFPCNFAMPDTLTAYRRVASKLVFFIAKAT
jgi:hypothetical protein